MKLLFVDDEPDIRELVEIALSIESEIDLRFESGGGDAIETLKSEFFDIIMLDVMMPPPDGIEILRAIRSNAVHDKTVVIMCTAKTSQEAEMELRELGANHVLHKPFKPLQLADFLSKLA